ncbi:catalase-like domain-containing protein [Melampsora americana]|nr:catalase-like domain-containing protein [Melampsora americana]
MKHLDKTLLILSLSFLNHFNELNAWPSSSSPNHTFQNPVEFLNHQTEPKQDFQKSIVIQLQASKNEKDDQLIYTVGNGQAYSDPMSAQRIGSNGPLLLQDHYLIENLAHFARERISERVVHAKGAGAHGTFTVTTDFAKKHTMMDVFSEVGKKTPISIRFSTVGGEQGSGDQARDPRGFAIKFRTQKGIWDLVMNNTPVFFLRDPAKFPNFIHTQKRNPRTHLKDPNMVWDYFVQNPEALHQFMRLFSDSGTPKGFVHMHGFTGHSYRWVQKDGSWVYVKLFAETNQGIQNFSASESMKKIGENPDYATEDLFNRIESNQFPSWTLYAQILTPHQAENFKYNVLDLTKDWPFDLVKKHEIGRFELNQNPQNFFAEIEQLAFSPSNLVDGWEPSTDPVLQARLFSYPDAQRHRLGVNFQQIPVNCPINPIVNFQRDGLSVLLGNQGSRMNYFSSFESKIKIEPNVYDESNHTIWTAKAIRSLSEFTEIDFDQPRSYWNSLSSIEKKSLIM